MFPVRHHAGRRPRPPAWSLRATQPAGRLAAIAELAAAGVPVGVLVAPVIPGLNDHEMPGHPGRRRQAGARFAGYVLLRLPHGLADLFERWLEQHYPRKRKPHPRTHPRAAGWQAERRRASAAACSAKGAGRADPGAVSSRLQGRRPDTRCPPVSTAEFRRPGSAGAAVAVRVK